MATTTRRWATYSNGVISILVIAGSVALAGLLVWIAWVLGDGDEGTQDELVKALLAVATAVASIGVVSVAVSGVSSWRADRVELAAERRRLANELREVHHDIKTAALRLWAHKSAKTYGEEMRGVVIPSVARLGAVMTDLRASSRFADRGAAQDVEKAHGYLTDLTDEFGVHYLTSSRLQEAAYDWRRKHMEPLAEAAEPPTLKTLQNLGLASETDDAAWVYLYDADVPAGQATLPRLRVLLDGTKPDREEPVSKVPDDAPDGTTPTVGTHATCFSDPLHRAMRALSPFTTGRGSSAPS